MVKIRAAIASSQEEMNAQAAEDRDDALRAEREIALLREIESVSLVVVLGGGDGGGDVVVVVGGGGGVVGGVVGRCCC